MGCLCSSKFRSEVCVYEQNATNEIRNPVVVSIARILQFAIIVFIVGYLIVYKKGYQEFSDVQSSETVKVKGVVYTNFSDDEFNPRLPHPKWYRRIWDVADYIIPPSENGATFIATNVIITENQTQGKCAEDEAVVGAFCTHENNTCVRGKSLHTGNGVMTGNCTDDNLCEIYAWCPVQANVFPMKTKTALLEESQHFTLLIKDFVNFPKFKNSNRRNIKETSDLSYLRHCYYDPYDNQDCPVFRLGDIVRWSGHKDYNDIAYRGGVIAVEIKWDCNLDHDKKICFPTYKFTRLDDVPMENLTLGWNFRFANHYSDGRRTLYKMYGIRLSIYVVGRAGKFRLYPTVYNFCIGFGLCAIVGVICDCIVCSIKQIRDCRSRKNEVDDSASDSELEYVDCEEGSPDAIRDNQSDDELLLNITT